MKYLQLQICASLMAVGVLQIQVEGSPTPGGGVGNVVFKAIKGAFHSAVGNKRDGYTKLPKCESSSTGDADELSKNEMSPPRRYFEFNDIYLDENNPGIQPNDEETLNQYAAALSGVTLESLLKALGIDKSPIKNAYYKSLTGLILGQARGRISHQTAMIFLEVFSQTVTAHEPILALKTISSTLAIIKILQDRNEKKDANQVFPQAIQMHFDGIPPPPNLWVELAPFVDRLKNGKGDEEASKKIIDVLASKYKAEFDGLKRTDPRRQEESLRTIIQHVVRYGKFLNCLREDKR